LLAARPVADGNFSLVTSKSTRPDVCTVFVVDDDVAIRGAFQSVIEDDGRNAACFANAEAFFAAYRPGGEACLLVDAYLPGMNGIALLHRLRQAGDTLPAIMITGNSDVPMAVEAMKAGASDFIEKPVGRIELLASITRALDQARDSTKLTAWRAEATSLVAGLTARQREIMAKVLAGQPSKNIAMDLGISQRTVENHRASIMRKTGSASLPALARLALAASSDEADASDTGSLAPGYSK
jgi:two-component system CheB/CheR fusion protein